MREWKYTFYGIDNRKNYWIEIRVQESIHLSYDRQATTLASRSSILAHSLTHSRSARLSGAWAAWAEFIPDKSCMQASSHGHGQSWPVRSGTGCDTRDSVAIPDLLPAAACCCLLPTACCLLPLPLPRLLAAIGGWSIDALVVCVRMAGVVCARVGCARAEVPDWRVDERRVCVCVRA